MENFGWVVAAAGATGVAAYALMKAPKPNIPTPVDLNDQTYVLKDGSRCSKMVPPGELMEYLYEDAKTLYEIFQRGIRVSNNGPCLGTRSGPNLEFEWLSYQEVHDRALGFGSWMLDQGIESGKETIIGIFSNNRVEWVVTEQACSAYSVVPVALYDTLGEDATKFIINQTELSLIVCDTHVKVEQLLKDIKETPTLKVIAVMDGVEKVDTSLAKGVKIVSFKDAVEQGQKNLKKPVPPKPDDLAMICYTSGTTGNPKGAMLTHKNLVSDLAGVISNVKVTVEYKPNDRYISFLPLPHMYERLVHLTMFVHGCQIGFFRGDVKLLVEDIQALKPTILSLVPRLMNRVYDKVMAGVAASSVKSKLFEMALASKKKELLSGIVRRDSIWDKIVFKKIQAIFGGQVRIITTGSAPIERKVFDFYRLAFSCEVKEGYGQTETTAAITLTLPGEVNAGHVGCPCACNIVKLVDCPDENYFAANGQGEVCAKGNNVFVGYYKDPKKTAETLDKDGWCHTGDIGEWLPNGALRIIDRKKNLFKLAQGEYVAPEKLENVYMRSQYVAQAFVEGDSLKPYVMAVIVPDEEVLVAWAKKQGLPDNLKDLCKSESVKDMILADINKIGKAAGLKTFELARDIYLQAEPFSVENELLTPTLKSKRPNLRRYFKQHVQDLYKKQESD